MSKDIEEINRIIKEGKITEVDDTFEKVADAARNIPDIKKKKDEVLLARGYVAELSTVIEVSFNELLFHMGDGEDRSGDRFMTKAKLVEELMLEGIPGIGIEREQFDIFQDFVSLRNIFAHVPINWFSEKLEFNSEGHYEVFFKRNSGWKDFSSAINHLAFIMGETIELIKSFVKAFLLHKQMTKEINKAVFGVDIPKEVMDEISRVSDKIMKEKGFKLNFGPE